MIEKLECMKASGEQNYDYVVLQATDNSIPFYESLGFVRVGAITEDDQFEEKQAKHKSDDESPPHFSPQSPQSESTSDIVSSATQVYVTKTAGETPADVAKKFNVDVWDIIFLNHFIFKDIQTKSRLWKGTSLYVPSLEEARAEATSHATRTQDVAAAIAPQWYIASENDTPKMIAKQFRVSCSELVAANRDRLPELQAISRLKEGTRVKVSHFHIEDDKHVPYCHWTFPDDTFGHNEPSYMMVRKLNRRKGAAAKDRPFESSLAVPVTHYTAPPPELFSSVQALPARVIKTPKKRRPVLAGEPKKPKRPVTGYMIYFSEKREVMKDEFAGMLGSEVMQVVSRMWQELPDGEKAQYQVKAQTDQTRYQKDMEKYKEDLAAFHKAHPELAHPELVDSEPKSAAADKNSLFNKVVKLSAEGSVQSGSEYEYYFVLTYIPDLQWCHLAPMVRVGTWGPDKPQTEGRPIWMLVNENEGKEVDISAAFCVPVRSRSMKRTVDADREQWDIIDSEESFTSQSKQTGEGMPQLAAIFTNRAKNGVETQSEAKTNALQSIEPKKKRGRPRKHPLPTESCSATKLSKTAGWRKIGDTEDDDYHSKKPPARPCHPATKSLTGTIEPKKKSGRPRKHPLPPNGAVSHSATELRTGSVEPKRKRERPTNGAEPHSEGEPRNGSIEPKKKRGRPLKNALPAESVHSETKPLPGSIQPKKTQGRSRKQSPPIKAAGRRKVGSDTEVDEWEPDAEKPPARGRVQPARQSHSATKPLTGSIEPKKKRGQPRKNPVPTKGVESLYAAEPSNGSIEPTKKRRLSRREPSLTAVVSAEESDMSIEVDSPPTKRRKLPPRRAAPVFYGSPQYMSEVEATPTMTRKTQVRGNAVRGSACRSVALTRSGSMTSPMMYSI